MSDANTESLMTINQVNQKLRHISTDKQDLKMALTGIVRQFQCLDRIAHAIGIANDGFSFAKKVTWQPVLSNLESGINNEPVNIQEVSEAVSSSSEILESEVVPKLTEWRNNWMVRVLVIEFSILLFCSMAIAGLLHAYELWNFSTVLSSISQQLYERPVFMSLIMSGLVAFLFVFHFWVRNFAAAQLLKEIKKESSEFDMAGAFLRNTRYRHSLFRPDIVGWGWMERKCLPRRE